MSEFILRKYISDVMYYPEIWVVIYEGNVMATGINIDDISVSPNQTFVEHIVQQGFEVSKEYRIPYSGNISADIRNHLPEEFI